MEKFGFEVDAPGREVVSLTSSRPNWVTTLWEVYLPHQCEAWEVVSTEDPAEAVVEMERFIAEAQNALAELRRRIDEQS